MIKSSESGGLKSMEQTLVNRYVSGQGKMEFTKKILKGENPAGSSIYDRRQNTINSNSSGFPTDSDLNKECNFPFKYLQKLLNATLGPCVGKLYTRQCSGSNYADENCACRPGERSVSKQRPMQNAVNRPLNDGRRMNNPGNISPQQQSRREYQQDYRCVHRQPPGLDNRFTDNTPGLEMSDKEQDYDCECELNTDSPRKITKQFLNRDMAMEPTRKKDLRENKIEQYGTNQNVGKKSCRQNIPNISRRNPDKNQTSRVNEPNDEIFDAYSDSQQNPRKNKSNVPSSKYQKTLSNDINMSRVKPISGTRNDNEYKDYDRSKFRSAHEASHAEKVRLKEKLNKMNEEQGQLEQYRQKSETDMPQQYNQTSRYMSSSYGDNDMNFQDYDNGRGQMRGEYMEGNFYDRSANRSRNNNNLATYANEKRPAQTNQVPRPINTDSTPYSNQLHTTQSPYIGYRQDPNFPCLQQEERNNFQNYEYRGEIQSENKSYMPAYNMTPPNRQLTDVPPCNVCSYNFPPPNYTQPTNESSNYIPQSNTARPFRECHCSPPQDRMFTCPCQEKKLNSKLLTISERIRYRLRKNKSDTKGEESVQKDSEGKDNHEEEENNPQQKDPNELKIVDTEEPKEQNPQLQTNEQQYAAQQLEDKNTKAEPDFNNQQQNQSNRSYGQSYPQKYVLGTQPVTGPNYYGNNGQKQAGPCVYCGSQSKGYYHQNATHFNQGQVQNQSFPLQYQQCRQQEYAGSTQYQQPFRYPNNNGAMPHQNYYQQAASDYNESQRRPCNEYLQQEPPEQTYSYGPYNGRDISKQTNEIEQQNQGVFNVADIQFKQETKDFNPGTAYGQGNPVTTRNIETNFDGDNCLSLPGSDVEGEVDCKPSSSQRYGSCRGDVKVLKIKKKQGGYNSDLKNDDYNFEEENICVPNGCPIQCTEYDCYDGPPCKDSNTMGEEDTPNRFAGAGYSEGEEQFDPESDYSNGVSKLQDSNEYHFCEESTCTYRQQINEDPNRRYEDICDDDDCRHLRKYNASNRINNDGKNRKILGPYDDEYNNRKELNYPPKRNHTDREDRMCDDASCPKLKSEKTRNNGNLRELNRQSFQSKPKRYPNNNHWDGCDMDSCPVRNERNQPNAYTGSKACDLYSCPIQKLGTTNEMYNRLRHNNIEKQFNRLQPKNYSTETDLEFCDIPSCPVMNRDKNYTQRYRTNEDANRTLPSRKCKKDECRRQPNRLSPEITEEVCDISSCPVARSSTPRYDMNPYNKPEEIRRKTESRKYEDIDFNIKSNRDQSSVSPAKIREKANISRPVTRSGAPQNENYAHSECNDASCPNAHASRGRDGRNDSNRKLPCDLVLMVNSERVYNNESGPFDKTLMVQQNNTRMKSSWADQTSSHRRCENEFCHIKEMQRLLKYEQEENVHENGKAMKKQQKGDSHIDNDATKQTGGDASTKNEGITNIPKKPPTTISSLKCTEETCSYNGNNNNNNDTNELDVCDNKTCPDVSLAEKYLTDQGKPETSRTQTKPDESIDEKTCGKKECPAVEKKPTDSVDVEVETKDPTIPCEECCLPNETVEVRNNETCCVKPENTIHKLQPMMSQVLSQQMVVEDTEKEDTETSSKPDSKSQQQVTKASQVKKIITCSVKKMQKNCSQQQKCCTPPSCKGRSEFQALKANQSSGNKNKTKPLSNNNIQSQKSAKECGCQPVNANPCNMPHKNIASQSKSCQNCDRVLPNSRVGVKVGKFKYDFSQNINAIKANHSVKSQIYECPKKYVEKKSVAKLSQSEPMNLYFDSQSVNEITSLNWKNFSYSQIPYVKTESVVFPHINSDRHNKYFPYTENDGLQYSPMKSESAHYTNKVAENGSEDSGKQNLSAIECNCNQNSCQEKNIDAECSFYESEVEIVNVVNYCTDDLCKTTKCNNCCTPTGKKNHACAKRKCVNAFFRNVPIKSCHELQEEQSLTMSKMINDIPISKPPPFNKNNYFLVDYMKQHKYCKPIQQCVTNPNIGQLQEKKENYGITE